MKGLRSILGTMQHKRGCKAMQGREYTASVEPRRAVVARTTASIKLDTQLVDEAMRVLGAKSRTEAVRLVLQEMVAIRRFKKLMKKHAGKLKFQGQDGKRASTGNLVT